MFEKGNWKNDARDFYNKKFYVHNDDGHKIDHIDDVYHEMMRLNISLELNLNEAMIFMTAYTHDLFSSLDRKNHHKRAMEYVIASSDPFLDEFDADELWLIGQAVNEHRASGKDEYSNDYSRIIRLADKGVPDLNKIIMRGYMCNHHKHDGNIEKTSVETYKHIMDKYSRDTGYGFKSKDYREVYKDELEEFWKDLDSLTIDEWCVVVEKGLKNELNYI